MQTHLGNAIEAVDSLKTKYDKNVKEIISDIQVLARIVKHTVTEVEKLSIEEIMECIDPQSIRVGTIPIVPGLTNLEKSKVYSRRIQFPMKAMLRLIFDFYWSIQRMK